MPAVLTHKTIMLLARERLGALRDALDTKLHGAGPKSDLEWRVWYLAKKAYQMMSDNVLSDRGVLFPSGADYPTPLGQDVSPFAVMGSMGPDITAFSALFAPGQGWVFDVVHKGNPDANLEPVVAKTTDFALEMWNQVSTSAAAGHASDDDVRRMRAYILGHLCHVAGDVISHPFIHDLEWHLGNRTRQKFSHAGGEASIDARVAQQILLRKSLREGQDWDKWWPTSGEVPDVFFTAYMAALDALHHAGDTAARPKGFGEFEAEFALHAPPGASVDFIKDGYHLYRHGIVSIGYGYGWGSWFGALVPLVIPMTAVIGLTGALPHSREFFTKPWFKVGERGWFELFTLPLAVGTLVPVVYGTWLATLTTRGVEGLTAAGLIYGWAGLVLAVIFFVTSAIDDVPWWVRWFFIFAPLFITPVVFTAIGAATVKDALQTGNGKEKKGGLALIYGAVPLVAWALIAVGMLLITMLGGALLDIVVGAIFGFDSTAEDVVAVAFYVLGMLLLVVVMMYLWFKAPGLLRDAKIPELPAPFPVDRPHFVRLFDDSTLFHKADLDTPTLAQLSYPSQRRPLLKLWYSGAGDLYVRSEQRVLAFSTTGTGAPAQRVQAPVIPMTVADLGAFLQGAVTGLHADVVYPGDSDKEGFLPTGAMFTEDSDDKGEKEGIPASAFTWKKLAKAADAESYVLRHADKPLQAVRFGQRGTVEQGTPQDEYSPGPGKVTATTATVTGTDTVFTFHFDPGDQIAVGTQVRTVTLVTSDTQLTIASPFSPAISAPSDYVRLGPTDDMAPCPGQVTSEKEKVKVTGTNTLFTQFLQLGDLLLVGNQAREVVAIRSDTDLDVDVPFDPPITTATDNARVTLGRERLEGYKYIPRAATAQAVGGGAVMDFAADFGALLCMGMAAHMLPQGERTISDLTGKQPFVGTGAIDDQVGKVYQVFRNWSLDRRRLNEWRMIVAGGAHPEKATANEYDAAMVQPQPGDWKPADVVQAGEPVSRAQGWVPVLRQWLARAVPADATSNAAGANGSASNLSLSQAMAFILDLKQPTRLKP